MSITSNLGKLLLLLGCPLASPSKLACTCCYGHHSPDGTSHALHLLACRGLELRAYKAAAALLDIQWPVQRW